MSETEFDIELYVVPSPGPPGYYHLLMEDGTRVGKFYNDRQGKETFYYFCHGLAVRGSFRIYRGEEVIAERRPDSRSGIGWFNVEGSLPCNPNNPF